MSDTLSIFVSNGPSIEECRNLIENHLRINLTKRIDIEGHLFEGEVLGACVALFDDHGLDDDCGIEFTKFPLEIDFTRYAGTKAPDWNEATYLSLAVSIAESLSKQFNSRCLIVENLQRIVKSI